MFHVLDYKFFTSSKLELSSNDPPLVLSVYFVFCVFFGWALLSSCAIIPFGILRSLGFVLFVNGILYTYVAYLIHKYLNGPLISCVFFTLSFFVYLFGIWEFYIVFGSFLFCVVTNGYLLWKEKYSHLQTFTDIARSVYNRQADVAHIL